MRQPWVKVLPFLFLLVLGVVHAVFGAGAALDLGFQSGSGANGTILKMILQTDGKILIAGYFSAYDGTARAGLARLNPDGQLDPDFVPGAYSWDFSFVHVQSDGKVLIGSSLTRRLNTDGSIDNSYNPVGVGFFNAHVLGVQSDGKLVRFLSTRPGTSGSYHTERLTGSGALDYSFNPIVSPFMDGGGSGGGTFVDRFDFGSVGPDDSIIAGGTYCQRMLQHGLNDSGFSGAAYVSMIVRQPDERILIVVTSSVLPPFAPPKGVSRLLANGQLDSTFAPIRTGSQNVRAIALQNDGKILVGLAASGSGSNTISRFNPDGTGDSSFESPPLFDGPINAMVVLPTGKILVAGAFTNVNGVAQNRIAQLDPDGLSSPSIASQPESQSVTGAAM